MGIYRRLRRIIALTLIVLLTALFIRVVSSSHTEIHFIQHDNMEIHVLIER